MGEMWVGDEVVSGIYVVPDQGVFIHLFFISLLKTYMYVVGNH